MRTMKSFILMTALLLDSVSWISVSASESQTVEVQPGEDVTLQCSNRTVSETQTDWFRLVNRTNVSCISSMYGANNKPAICDGIQNGKFEMSSNVSNVFLKIKRVDLSDSGLYFCGFYINRHTVIADVIRLSVQGYSEADDATCLKTINILGAVTGTVIGTLIVVGVVLAVKNKKCQTAANEEPQPERKKNPDSDDLNYAAVSFKPQQKRNRRPASEREKELSVVYAATR